MARPPPGRRHHADSERDKRQFFARLRHPRQTTAPPRANGDNRPAQRIRPPADSGGMNTPTAWSHDDRHHAPQHTQAASMITCAGKHEQDITHAEGGPHHADSKATVPRETKTRHQPSSPTGPPATGGHRTTDGGPPADSEAMHAPQRSAMRPPSRPKQREGGPIAAQVDSPARVSRQDAGSEVSQQPCMYRSSEPLAGGQAGRARDRNCTQESSGVSMGDK